MTLPDRRFDVTFDSENSDQRLNLDFDSVQRVSTNNYNDLYNKPTLNGVEIVGDQTTESLGIDPLPSGGQSGDILMKTPGGSEWQTPASSAQPDNTLPITSAAVYTEIGNINALLATI